MIKYDYKSVSPPNKLIMVIILIHSTILVILTSNSCNTLII